LKRWWWAACAALLMGACTQDSPTDVGGELLPPDAIQTWEVLIESDRFIAWDTSFGVYSQTAGTDYLMLANAYDGVLSSRGLIRFAMPRTIALPGTGSTVVIDSFPRFIGGSIRLGVDTTIAARQDARVELYATTENWDRLTATWTLRVDSPGRELPWTQPGGSPGTLVGVGNYVAGSDSLIIQVDSATVAAWADTTNTGRGGILTMGSAGQRLRTTIPVLRARARASVRDTVVEVPVAPGRTFIYTPDPPDTASAPRVGGVPEWRTILRMRDQLDTLTVPCPPGSAPGCRVRMRDVTLNYAALRLQPVVAPAGFRPEAPIDLTGHALLPVQGIPLHRSPLTDAVSQLAAPVPVSSFVAPGAPVVELPLTSFLRLVFAGEETDFTATHIALVQVGLLRTFGFGEFAPMPPLRLILTTAKELQLP